MLRFPRNKFSGMLGSILPRTQEEDQVIAEARINGGMVTLVDAADIANNQFQEVCNFVVRDDQTSRRYGSLAYSPAKPNANKILLIAPYKQFDEDQVLVRFTASTIHISDGTAWTAMAGVLTGGPNDRFRFTIANDRFFFANNGVDEIQELDIGAGTFAQAGNAPRYKYITSFNNRILGAHLQDAITPTAIEVGWSGNLNYTEWDSTVDKSAGNVSLVDSPTDYSDNITGIFGFTETALLLRERSLWGINKQPIASNPFVFSVIAPAIGCDCPFSATTVKNGICWYDYRTNCVYVYKLGMTEPEEIGSPVSPDIHASITDKETLFGSYNPIEDEYTLGVPSSTSSITVLWTYNFRAKAWYRETQTNISALATVDYSSGEILIDDLSGTIDELIGLINDLGRSTEVPSRMYGNTTGDILLESDVADQDNSVDYTSQLISKVYTLPKNATYYQYIQIKFIPQLEGSFSLYYSKDNGSWQLYKTVTWDNTQIGLRKRVDFKKHVRSGEYSWKLETTAGLFDLIQYHIVANVADGDTKTN